MYTHAHTLTHTHEPTGPGHFNPPPRAGFSLPFSQFHKRARPRKGIAQL